MQRPGLSTRLTGAALVAVLHVALITGLLFANLAPGVVRLAEQSPHETEMVLPLPQLPQKATAPVKGPEHNGTASVVSPDTNSPFFSPPASASALGAVLFGCAPENLRNLSREQQEKCLKLAGGRYAMMKEGLPLTIKPPGPEWEGLRNSDIRARERNTADPCLIAKRSGTECYHEIIYGKTLW